MCTVTFIARQNGFGLGMNRDEQRTRVAAHAPRQHRMDDRALLCPTEPGGGTWIAVNDLGVTFALINWYAIPATAAHPRVSRGQVIRDLGAARQAESAHAVLQEMSLHQMNPFRLIGIFPATRTVVEWRWDLKQLTRRSLRWQTRQWVSSGYNEPAAQRGRGRTFREALQQRSVGTLAWLRRLHRSHAPEPGPFATCMHRADAATVSYTEVVVTPRMATMRYHAAAPCELARCRVTKLRVRPVLERGSVTRSTPAMPVTRGLFQ
jgi:hypothetical protein